MKLRQLVNIEDTQKALSYMHKDVKQRADHNRKKQREAHNRKTNIKPVNFTVGDFVLVRRAKAPGHKMKFMWVGPRRITACKSEWVYEVEHLLKGSRETVHAKRMFLYRAGMDGKEVVPELLKAAEHTEAVYQDAHELVGIRKRGDALEIQIKWEGLPDAEDWTWEPLSQVHEDTLRY